MFNWYLEW